MTAIQSVCLLLVSAHVLGRLAVRLGQPELLGQMIAGIVLGPALLNWVAATPGLNALSDFSILFVVIAAGLEMRLHAVTDIFKGRGLVALLPGFVLPGLLGWVLAASFGFSVTGALVVALCVSVTALPVALRILSDFGLMATRIAHVTIAGALLADIVVLLTLGVISSSTQHDAQPLSVLLGLGSIKLLALLSSVVLGAVICKTLYRRSALQPLRLASTQLSFALLLILLLAATSEAMGFSFAVGAFLGALTVNEYYSDGRESHPLRAHVEGLSLYIFAPLFLACQGTHFTVAVLAHPTFIVALVVVAIGSKLVGGYWTGRWCGLPHHEAQGTAIVMNARGVMEMVVASIAYRAGLVDGGLFSTLLLVGVVTTICTPLLLKRWQKQSVAIVGAISKTD